MVLPHDDEEQKPNGRWKEQRGTETSPSSEPQKANLTGKFVVVL